MAAAIPAAIGVGSSIVGGIQGKGAAKQQRKLAEQMLAMNKPFLQNQLNVSNMAVDALSRNLNPLLASYLAGSDEADQLGDFYSDQYNPLMGDALGRESELYGQGTGLIGEGRGMIGEGRGLFDRSLGYLDAASRGLNDVQAFYRPFMFSGRRAIDQFLPTAKRTFENIAPEISGINEGFRSAQDNIARFAPRGGGRVSSMARADIDRNRQISDQFFQSRLNTQGQGLQAAFQGAAGSTNAANSLRDLFQAGTGAGLGKIGAGLNTVGAGQNTIRTGADYLTSRGGLAQNAANLGLNAKGLSLSNRQGLSSLLQMLTGANNQAGSALPGLFNAQANRGYDATFNREGSGLGGFLVDLFNNKKVQGGVDDLFGKLFKSNQPTSGLPNITFG
jgi:hypothetical protein